MQHIPEAFLLRQGIISIVIVLYKVDVLVGLIISKSTRIEIELSHRIIQSVIGQQAKSTCSVTKQLNLVLDRVSLFLSCIRLVKVSRSLVDLYILKLQMADQR